MKTRPLFRTVVAWWVIALASMAGGCASYEIKVDAMKRPGPLNPELTSFKIQNRDPALTEDSLRYKELANHIKTALSGHGLWEARDANSADMIVEVTCGISGPKIIYESDEIPVLETASDHARRENGGSPSTQPAPVIGEREPKDNFGYAERDIPIVVREKHMTVSCHVNRKGAEGAPATDLWRVSVSIEDESKDLREYLPILASALMEQIGRDTDGLVIDTLGKRDAAIAFIKKGI